MTEAQVQTLHDAVETGFMYNVQMSLASGANVDEQNEDGDSALHLAVEGDEPDIIQLLLQSGANVNCTNNDGDSPLHIACSMPLGSCRDDVTQMLINYGANVNVRNNENGAENDDSAGGRTPLHVAIMNPSIKVARTLLYNGADMSITEREGYNALHWAVQMHSWKSDMAHIRTHDDDLLDTDASAIEYATRIIQLLLSHDTDFRSKIDLLRATTGDGISFDPETAEALASTENIKTMLRDALQHAEEDQQQKLDAFIMGHHVRLGAATYIPDVPLDVLQLILDRI